MRSWVLGASIRIHDWRARNANRGCSYSHSCLLDHPWYGGLHKKNHVPYRHGPRVRCPWLCHFWNNSSGHISPLIIQMTGSASPSMHPSRVAVSSPSINLKIFLFILGCGVCFFDWIEKTKYFNFFYSIKKQTPPNLNYMYFNWKRIKIDEIRHRRKPIFPPHLLGFFQGYRPNNGGLVPVQLGPQAQPDTWLP